MLGHFGVQPRALLRSLPVPRGMGTIRGLRLTVSSSARSMISHAPEYEPSPPPTRMIGTRLMRGRVHSEEVVSSVLLSNSIVSERGDNWPIPIAFLSLLYASP